jgi:phospholipid/cholesterol/gamma-HCH transport system permease protein
MNSDPSQTSSSFWRIAAPVVGIGNWSLSFMLEFGRIIQFGWAVLGQTFRGPFRAQEFFRHMREIGFGTLFIVVFTGFFTGLVFGLQTLIAFRRFGAESLVGPATMLALARELAPVLTGMMVAGRSGSGMATEIGTMRVTEQIDALEMMAVSPIHYLVVPRVIAAMIMVPFLCAVFDGSGFIGAYIMGVTREGVDPGIFLAETWYGLDPPDFFEGYIKAFFFGGVIALVSCYKGFNAKGGSRGVGRASTEAVVISSVSILVGTYIITELLHPFLYGYIYFDQFPKVGP